MFKNRILLLVLFCFSTSYSQVGGRAVYQFLNLVPSPRQAALGGKVVTNYDQDVNQAHFNPASINSEMDRHLSLNYGSFLGEVSYGTASYAHTFKQKHLFHAGVNYINYGTFDGRDELGNDAGDFSGSEAALSIGYAHTILLERL
jgi:hypothetical protein